MADEKERVIQIDANKCAAARDMFLPVLDKRLIAFVKTEGPASRVENIFGTIQALRIMSNQLEDQLTEIGGMPRSFVHSNQATADNFTAAVSNKPPEDEEPSRIILLQ